MSAALPAEHQKTLSPPRSCVAHAWLTSPVYQQLVLEADRRGMHPDRLLASITTTILVNGYVDALLDR